VILRGDFDLIGEEILHRMVGTVVAKFQLVRFAAQREAAELVAEADAEDRHAAGKVADIFDSEGGWLGIAGAVGEENTVGLHGEDIFGRGLRGDDGDIAMMVDEQAQDVLLDAEVVGDDFVAAVFALRAGFAHLLGPGRASEVDGAFVPGVGLLARDAGSEFLTGHAGELLGFKDELIGGRAVGGNDTAQGADFANVTNQGARVDIPDDRNFVAVQVELGGFRGAPIGRDLGELAHDERFDVRMGGFFVVEVGADVADVRISEADDLPGVTGIGENFLITGEAGIKNDFTAAARDGAGGAAIKDAPVFQGEYGGSVQNF
jgi:hypothetical protein